MRLAVGLLFSEVSDNGDLEALAIEGVDQHDDPEDEETQTDEGSDDEREQAQARDPAKDDEPYLNYHPGDGHEDGLPGMEADVRDLVEGLDDQENDRGDDGDVCQATRGIIGKTGLCHRGWILICHKVLLEV